MADFKMFMGAGIALGVFWSAATAVLMAVV